MKHPSKIFLQSIASRYRQISSQKVAKIQLLGKKLFILNSCENKVLAQKTVENQRFWE